MRPSISKIAVVGLLLVALLGGVAGYDSSAQHVFKLNEDFGPSEDELDGDTMAWGSNFYSVSGGPSWEDGGGLKAESGRFDNSFSPYLDQSQTLAWTFEPHSFSGGTSCNGISVQSLIETGAGCTGGYILSVDDYGNIEWQSNGVVKEINSDLTPSNGRRTVVFEFTGSSFDAYVDGEYEGGISYSGAGDPNSPGSSFSFDDWEADVFHFRKWDIELTESEISNYNECGEIDTCNDKPVIQNASLYPDPPEIGNASSFYVDSNDPDGNISKITLEIFKDGNLNYSETVSGVSENNFTEVYTPESDGELKAVFTVEDDFGATVSDTITRTIDETPPSIEIFKPETPTRTRTDLSLNYTVSDKHLDSSSCKYSKDGGTNFSLQNCGNTTIDYGSVGLHNLTVYASDTYNNTGKAFKQLFVDEVNEIRAVDQETSTEISEFEVTLSNGTESIGGQAVNGSFRFNTSNAPTGDVNLSLVADGYRPLNQQLQIDDSFSLNQSFGLERAGLYIDAKDEKTEGDIQFNLTLSNSTDVYSKEDITEFQEDYKDFADKNITTGEVTASISSSGYQTREYFYSIDENSKISLTPYLLAKNQGIYVSLEVYDSAGNDLQDATLTIQRQFSGEWKTVSQKTTETTGGASFFLDPETTYRFVASKGGYETFRGTFSPSNYQYDPLKIYLGTQNQDSYSTVLEAVEYSLRPQEGIISGVQEFELNVTDKEEKLSSFGLRAYNESGGLEKSSIVQTSPSGGSTSLQVNTTGMGNEITVESFFQRENQTYSYENTYRVLRPLESGEFSLIQSKRYLEKHLSMFARSLLTLLIVVGVTLPASKSDRLDTNGAGVVGLAILGVATANNFFPGAIFILTLLPVIGIYLMRIR